MSLYRRMFKASRRRSKGFGSFFSLRTSSLDHAYIVKSSVLVCECRTIYWSSMCSIKHRTCFSLPAWSIFLTCSSLRGSRSKKVSCSFIRSGFEEVLWKGTECADQHHSSTRGG
jgi:hypothetical protein